MFRHYTAISDALIFSERRPRRGLFLFVLQKYQILVGVFITIILWISSFRYAPLWTITWIILYWLYLLVKRAIGKKGTVLGISYWSKWVQLIRSIFLILAITVYLYYLYVYTDYLRDNGGIGTLWLLYILAIFIMSQYGVTELMVLTAMLSSIALSIITYLAITDLSGGVWYLVNTWDVIVKSTWLFFLAFVLHTLLRSIGDRSADLNLLHAVQQNITGIRSILDERELLNTAVNSIASNFGYSHVNIFELHSDGSLKCVAGASNGGNSLVNQGFYLEPSKNSIVVHVAKTGKSYYSNDVSRDRYYLRHPSFPGINSELTVPIKIGTKTIAILDIQEKKKNAFLQEDEEVMEIMAGQVSKAWDNIKLMESRMQISQIIGSIAQRFLSKLELQSTLSEIVQTACDYLSADVVVLYERDPITGKVSVGANAGNLHYQEYFDGTVDRTYNQVHKLISAEKDYYFHEDLQDVKNDPLFMSTNSHERGYPRFAEREKIVSRAILRLRSGINCVGLMFLNFRSPRNFDEQEKYFIFADLAALAIQKAQFQRQQIQFEREDLARQLHDQIMAHTFTISHIVSAVLDDIPQSDTHYAKLDVARIAVRELTRDVKYLHNTWKAQPLDDLCNEVETVAKRAMSAYDVSFNIEWDGCENSVSPIIVNELRFVLNEAIINAIKHGKASEIKVFCSIDNSSVILTIEDNGCGFDLELVKPNGLTNMRNRTKLLGGKCKIESSLDLGTRVSVNIPLRNHMERRKEW